MMSLIKCYKIIKFIKCKHVVDLKFLSRHSLDREKSFLG